jgi:hypothetical protein
MRAIIFVLCLAMAAAPALASQTATLPPVVRAGLEAYKTTGAPTAMKTWLTNSPIVEQVNTTVPAFENIEHAYGRMVGYETLEVIPMGTHASRSYVILLYEKGPVYMWFDCYKSKDDWIMTSFLMNTKPDIIIPPKLLGH